MSGMGRASGMGPGQSGALGDELKQEVSHASSRAKEKLSDTTERLAQHARTFSEQQKIAGAEQVHDVASAVHTAARELENRMPGTASMIHAAADQLNNAASALRDRGVNELWRDVQDFARREPALFFCGAFALGFVASRFLKSSAEAEIASQVRGRPITADGPAVEWRPPGNADAYMGGRDGI